jgi:hypothetical protein
VVGGAVGASGFSLHETAKIRINRIATTRDLFIALFIIWKMAMLLFL